MQFAHLQQVYLSSDRQNWYGEIWAILSLESVAAPHVRWHRCSSEPGAPTAEGRQTARVWRSWDPEEPLCIVDHWGQKRSTLKSWEREKKGTELFELSFTLMNRKLCRRFLPMNLKEAVKCCGTEVHLLSAADCSIDSFKLLSLGNVLALWAEGNAIRCNGGQHAGDQMTPAA